MENRLPLRISLGLILTVMLAYSSVLLCGFVNYDDNAYVFNNPHVKTGLSWNNVVWAWTSFYAANWHPLTWMSHMLDCQLFGLNPRQHHVVNLFWHLANTVGLYLVLRRMTGDDWRSALVAALFGLHPLHVESVAWVAERKDVLSTFFAILTLGMYARYAARPSAGRYLVVAASFTLGLLAKPMLVTWPFVLLLMDYWPLRRCSFSPAVPDREPDTPRFVSASWYRLLLEKLPLLLLAVGSSLLTMQAQIAARQAGMHLSLFFRCANALVAYTAYLRKMVWPTDLAILYQHPGTYLPMRSALVSAMVLLALTGVVLLGCRRRPALLVGWLWYLGTLVPVIGLVQVGLQSMADRYTYIPLIGIFMAVAWSIPSVPESRSTARAVLGCAAVLLLLFYTALTWRQTLYWRDTNALWGRVARVVDSPFGRCYWAGHLLYKEGRVADAEEQCQAALRLDSEFTLAWFTLGECRLRRGELEKAQEAFARGLSTEPDSSGLHDALGRTLACQGQMEAACREFRIACRMNPEVSATHFNLATALARRGDWAAAEVEYEEGRRLNPERPEQAQELAEKYRGEKGSRFHNPVAALFFAEEACQGSTEPTAQMYQTLAQILADLDRPVAARTAARRAIMLAESNGPGDLLSDLREQLRSCEPLARQRETRALTLAVGTPAILSLSASLLTLDILGAGQAEHRLPGDSTLR